LSERGYLAADAARLRASRIALAERDERAAIRACLGEVRAELASLLQLNTGTEILLAASGTDSELLALALCHAGGDQQAPICNILIGPEETGRGVPLAACGFHFAVDTALGIKVAPGTLIDGFREDTRLCSIAIRDESGLARPVEAIENDIRATVKEALSRGDRVLLHVLDLSKTGLLAPTPSLLIELRRTYGGRIDIVVDGCQTRLSPSSIRRYLEMDAVVQITGSKFFTGPPFSGAALVPRGMSRRIKDGKMPDGLIDYFGQDEFISASSTGRRLHHTGNIGLALRWHAALSEMRAFFEIPALDRISILRQFGEMVQSILATDPMFARVSQPHPMRFSDKKSWETIPTIFPFFVVDQHSSESFMGFEKLQAIYRWLNTDLSNILPHEKLLASKICHIGQPVCVANTSHGKSLWALRISAGARFVSGELSHAHLPGGKRLKRELMDVKTAFEKVSLIVRNWDAVQRADPRPCYASIQDA